MQHAKAPCALLLTLAIAASLPAEEPAAPPAERTFLDAITVTATRGERELHEVPGTVTVIGGEQIEERLVGDARDLVRYEPGLYVASSSERLGLGGFNIRGVGGNRVLTRIDGVPAAEGFEFGHFTVPPFVLDTSSVESVEILRGPASSLYGSDALGGVVSFQTKDPAHYLGGKRSHLGLELRWDDRYDQASTTLAAAFGGSRWRGSLTATARRGEERDNQGERSSRDETRTAPNPQEHDSLGWLAKATFDRSERSLYKLAAEGFDHRGETEVLSSQGLLDLGAILGFPPSVTFVVDKASVLADDRQRRLRLSLEHGLTGAWLDHLLWRVHLQESDTEQRTEEIRITTLGGGFFGPLASRNVLRRGLLTFDERKLGGELRARHELPGNGLLTIGASHIVDRFDQLRDRPEVDLDTGEPLAASDGLTYPTKYFPESRVSETGLYAQAELPTLNGRLVWVPSLRYDRFDLGIDANDEIFLTGNLGTRPPVELSEGAVSPKLGLVASLGHGLTLHAQYARGFRSPPYSAVNSGFTHLAGGLTRLPNPELEPETSDGFEVGLRGGYRRASFGVTAFDNRYDGFIELVTLGLNPATGLIEFQQVNLSDARIYGLEATADLRVGERWYGRASLSASEGEDRSLRRPLNSIHPPQLAFGLRRSLHSGRGSVELAGRWAAAKEHSDLDTTEHDQFATPAYEVFDLFGSWELSETLTLRAGLYNLTDTTYWEWADALGLATTTPVLDRYTAPGRNAAIAVRYRR